ncbi:MAG: hypothetical protein Q4G18_00205 [Myroides sp.]|nr:hypothetical protein [Myroides sp.]
MQFQFPITSTEILLNCIPQRQPIVMVDSLLCYAEAAVTAGFTVNKTCIFTRDNQLTEPGLIEHMAQTVALHTGFAYFIKKEAAPTGYIGSIANLKIDRLPKVDEKIETTATILHEFGGVTLVDIVSKIKNEIIAQGQMKTVIAK